MGSEPFHYGSHYSSAGIVLYYLLRMEPYTTENIRLQGGRFDVADRLFDSISQTWASCLKDMSDVKELVPEFYYLPDFLRNANDLGLGTTQRGHTLGDGARRLVCCTSRKRRGRSSADGAASK